MSAPAIETENLSKEYPHGFLNLKKRTSLERLSMQVEEGEIFGFIGPNGAGKSTTIKLLMRLIFPTAGLDHRRRNRKGDGLISEIADSRVADVSDGFASAGDVDLDLVFRDQGAKSFSR